METYTGLVFYSDGWHWSVDDDMNLDRRLYLDEGTGQYRFAVDGDKSWHERFHQQYVELTLE